MANEVRILPGSLVWCRVVEMPLKKKREIESALPFQLEPLLPFEEAYTSWMPLGEGEISVFATAKTSIEGEEVVVPAPACLALLLDHLYPSELPQAVLHRGVDEILFVVAQRGAVLAFRSLPPDAPESEIERTTRALSQRRNPRLRYSTILDTRRLRMSPFGEAHGDPIQQGLELGAKPIYTPPISLKRNGWRFALAALLLATSLIFASKTSAIAREQAIATQYESLNLPSQESVEAMLKEARAEKRRLQAAADPYPLISTAPAVSEVLSFLSTHPQMQEGISIEKLAYKLVTLPTAKRPKESYQVKVEMSFKADTPTRARAVHDALTQIESDKPVGWSSKGELYTATFHLRSAP
jgi:hypothetical protein